MSHTTRERNAHLWRLWVGCRTRCPQCSRATTLMRGVLHSIEPSGLCAGCEGTAVTTSGEGAFGKMFPEMRATGKHGGDHEADKHTVSGKIVAIVDQLAPKSLKSKKRRRKKRPAFPSQELQREWDEDVYL